jgi:hypothetical protein
MFVTTAAGVQPRPAVGVSSGENVFMRPDIGAGGESLNRETPDFTPVMYQVASQVSVGVAMTEGILIRSRYG